MDVAFEAEDAMAKYLGKTVLAIDLPKREYILTKNRFSRNFLKLFGAFSPNLFFGCGKNVFLYLMWCDSRVYPLMRHPGIRKTIYIFDSWEPAWSSIEDEMMRWKNVNAVYFSSSQIVNYLRNKVPYPVRWCPQATAISAAENHPVLEVLERPLVLNIGRPNKILSQFFVKFCSDTGMKYISQDSLEGIIFQSRQDFINTLLRSAIVIVHPRNIDYPEVTGCVSMLTSRYFEAYHSGGVVCGFKPSTGEFEKVLGDLPFVEYSNPTDFKAQLLEAMQKKDIWLEARSRIQKEHSWEVRAKFMLDERDYFDS